MIRRLVMSPSPSEGHYGAKLSKNENLQQNK